MAREEDIMLHPGGHHAPPLPAQGYILLVSTSTCSIPVVAVEVLLEHEHQHLLFSIL